MQNIHHYKQENWCWRTKYFSHNLTVRVRAMIDISILDDSDQSGAETNYQKEDEMIKNVNI